VRADSDGEPIGIEQKRDACIAVFSLTLAESDRMKRRSAANVAWGPLWATLAIPIIKDLETGFIG
jgi:hypothetical protein